MNHRKLQIEETDDRYSHCFSVFSLQGIQSPVVMQHVLLSIDINIETIPAPCSHYAVEIAVYNHMPIPLILRPTPNGFSVRCQ